MRCLDMMFVNVRGLVISALLVPIGLQWTMLATALPAEKRGAVASLPKVDPYTAYMFAYVSRRCIIWF